MRYKAFIYNDLNIFFIYLWLQEGAKLSFIHVAKVDSLPPATGETGLMIMGRHVGVGSSRRLTAML